MAKTNLVWEKVTHSGKHHAILFIDTVFKGYQEDVIRDFFRIDFNPIHYRQFNGARWWLKSEIDAFIKALKNKEKNNPKFLLQKAAEYEKLNQDFLNWAKEYKYHNFAEDNNKQLAFIFLEWVTHLSKINALVYTTAMLDRFYTDEIVRLVAEHEQDFNKQQEYLNTIFTIDWGLEMHYERESLILIAEKMKRANLILTDDIKLLIQNHIERFAHLNLLAFYGQPNKEESVLILIKDLLEKDLEKEKIELERQKNSSQKVEEVTKILGLSNEEIIKIKTLRKWAFVANNDDHYVMGAIYALWNLWYELAKRFDISFEQFVEMRIKEIIEALDKGAISDELKKDLIARQKDNALVWDKQGIRLLVGKELEKYYEEEKQIEEDFHHIKEVRGQSASPGKAIGTVQIINDVREIGKVEKGNILVAVYTYPAIVVAMGKASAIVTDQGGLLSHAAIVSREFGKPCIVGTNIATKVFRDGDYVEVDADEGIIKKVK